MGFNTDILNDSEVSAYGKLIYFTLSKYVGEDGTCWPSQKTLQKTSGLSKNTVYRALKELEEAKYVISKHRFVNRMKTSSLYLLPNLVKSDTPNMTNDTPEMTNRNSSNKPINPAKSDTPNRGLGWSPQGDKLIHNNLLNINNDEQKVLDYLPKINNYPFNTEKDLAQIREWLSKHSADFIIEELEKFNAWWRDKESSFKGKKNFRSSITNWLKKAEQNKQATKPKRRFLDY